MAFEKARQSLNQLEEALRRRFGLVGQIGAELQPTVISALIAGDLREPGHNTSKGRCWAFAPNNVGTAAGVQVMTIQFSQDVIVEGFVFGSTVSGFLNVYVGTPSETVPNGLTQDVGAWRDRKEATNDIPPIRGSAGFGALTGTAMAENNRLITVQNSNAFAVPMSVMIPAGGWLAWRSDTAQTRVTLGCWGRIFP